MYEKEFADRMYHLRDNIGVSARFMSQDLGFNDGYISSIENGKSLPKMGSFFRICSYLGVTPLEFFDMSNPDPQKTSILYEELSGLSESELEHVLCIVRDILKNKPVN